MQLRLSLSPRQVNALRFLVGASSKQADGQRIVGLDHIQSVDQRPLGGLGKREMLTRRSEQNFVIRREALQALQAYEQMDVFRTITTSSHLAAVFEVNGYARAGRKKKG